MIEAAIKSLLLGEVSVSGHTPERTSQAAAYASEVQKHVGNRVYRAQLPRNAAQLMNQERNLPAIWYWRTTTDRGKTHDGPISLINATISLHVVRRDTFTVNRVLEQVRLLLDGWRGAAGGVTVDRIWVHGGQDYFEDPIGAAELALAESNIELNCWFRESLV